MPVSFSTQLEASRAQARGAFSYLYCSYNVYMDRKQVTVLYDADCRFCDKCRNFAEKRQGENTTLIFKDIGDRNADSIIVDPDGLKLEKFPASLYIAKHMKQPWPFIAAIGKVIPNAIGNWGYDWVSRHRNFLMKLLG